jgi:hypothetical protein
MYQFSMNRLILSVLLLLAAAALAFGAPAAPPSPAPHIVLGPKPTLPPDIPMTPTLEKSLALTDKFRSWLENLKPEEAATLLRDKEITYPFEQLKQSDPALAALIKAYIDNASAMFDEIAQRYPDFAKTRQTYSPDAIINVNFAEQAPGMYQLSLFLKNNSRVCTTLSMTLTPGSPANTAGNSGPPARLKLGPEVRPPADVELPPAMLKSFELGRQFRAWLEDLNPQDTAALLQAKQIAFPFEQLKASDPDKARLVTEFVEASNELMAKSGRSFPVDGIDTVRFQEDAPGMYQLYLDFKDGRHLANTVSLPLPSSRPEMEAAESPPAQPGHVLLGPKPAWPRDIELTPTLKQFLGLRDKFRVWLENLKPEQADTLLREGKITYLYGTLVKSDAEKAALIKDYIETANAVRAEQIKNRPDLAGQSAGYSPAGVTVICFEEEAPGVYRFLIEFKDGGSLGDTLSLPLAPQRPEENFSSGIDR